MSPQNRRESYRVLYPLSASPTFHWRGETARVIDCSEHGFRLQVQSYRDVPPPGERVDGRIVFLDQSVVEISGIVCHASDRVVGVRLEDPGVPWRVLLWEQVRLRARESGWVEVAD